MSRSSKQQPKARDLDAIRAEAAKLQAELDAAPLTLVVVESSPEYRAMVAAVRRWLLTQPKYHRLIEIVAWKVDGDDGDTLAQFLGSESDPYLTGSLAAISPGGGS